MAEPQFVVYKDNRGEWRWRLRASNGKIIADSGEGYKNKQDCLQGDFEGFFTLGLYFR